MVRILKQKNKYIYVRIHVRSARSLKVLIKYYIHQWRQCSYEREKHDDRGDALSHQPVLENGH